MTEIYWITRIGELNTAFVVMCALAFISFVIWLVAIPAFYTESDEGLKGVLKKWGLCSCFFLFIGILGDVLTPSKKDALLIYGLGTTIDYMKSDDKAKQLPDKAVEALTRYLDEISKEDNKKE